MSLTAVASLPPGCSQLKMRCVASRKDTFAFAGPRSVSLHKMEEKNVIIPITDPQQLQQLQQQGGAAAASTTTTTTAAVAVFPFLGVFGRGLAANVGAFDYNDDFLACLSLGAAKVTVWSIADGTDITQAKIAPTLDQVFEREGRPITMRVAGKGHLLFGNASGKLISLNTAQGHEPRAIALAPAAPASTRGSFQQHSAEKTEAVACIDVSSVRADLVAAGTVDGVLNLLTLSASEGLRVTAAIVPFPPPEKETKSVLPPAPLPVSLCVFDNINSQYIAVGSQEGALVLCDTTRRQVVQKFEYDTKGKTGTQLSGLAWVPDESGSFYTVSADSGVVRKWQINSPTCVGVFSPVLLEEGEGIVSIACLGKERVVLGLTTGAVKLFNIALRKTEFETAAAHTDSALAGAVSPSDGMVAATGGADGTVRVWNLRQMSPMYVIRTGGARVSSVVWAPNGKSLTVGLSSGEVVQYTCSTRKEAWRTPVATEGGRPVACSLSGEYVAATSGKGVTVLSHKDGRVLHRFVARAAVTAVAFEPTGGRTLAVGCEDASVQLYSLASNSEAPVMGLVGHTGRVAAVAFNPAVPHMLATAAEDRTVRVWDLSSNDAHAISASARVLAGHTDAATALCWCTLAPYLLLSGGADGSVRLWDARSTNTNTPTAPIATVCVHQAAVTSLSCNPERPLVFLSTSLDSATVVWHLGHLRQVYLDAVLGRLEERIASGDAAPLLMQAAGDHTATQVCGVAVVQLAQGLRDSNLPAADRMARLVDFFDAPGGAGEVVEMCRYVLDPQNYSASGKNIFVPAAKLLEAHRARTKHAIDKAQGKTAAKAGPEYKKERLLEAAELLLRGGQLEDYCKILIEAEEWDRAIAVAPMISREHWRNVCLSAAQFYEAAGSPRAVTYYILGEDSAQAARLLSQQSPALLDAATVVSQTCPQRAAADQGAVQEPNHLTATDAQGAGAYSRELQKERLVALDRFGSPRLSSAALLSTGAADDAVRDLLHCGDVSLTYLLVHTVPLRDRASIDGAFRLAMLQCAQQRRWETALECAARLSNPYDGLATLVALFQHTQCEALGGPNPPAPQSVNEKLSIFYDTVRQKCRQLQLPLDAQTIQQQHASDGLASQNVLASMVIASDAASGPVTPSQVLQNFNGYLVSLLETLLQDVDGANTPYYLAQAYTVSAYVSLPIAPHDQQQQQQQQQLLQPYQQQQQQSPGTQPLAAEHREFLCLVYLVAALYTLKVYRLPHLLNPAFSRASEMRAGGNADQLLRRAQGALNSYGPRSVEVDTAAGALLPLRTAEGALLKSALTEKVVCGAPLVLENGTSVISKSEGLAWGLCCHFSPLGTGARLSAL